MGYKLFIDDLRDCPPGWLLARTNREAIYLLATHDIEVVSLDHDIVCPCDNCGSNHFVNETFEPIAWYLKQMLEKENKLRVIVHSANWDKAKAMCSIMGLEFVKTYRLYDPKYYAEEILN